MDLFIVTLTGTSFKLRVSPCDTVKSIKSKIQQSEGIPVGLQHLIWQNNELSDHLSLQDICIPDNAVFRLVLGMRVGPISTHGPPPFVVATATIKFTPDIRLASASRDGIDQANDNGDISSVPQSSLLNQNDRNAKSQQQTALYFLNTGDNFDLMRVIDRRRCSPLDGLPPLDEEHSIESKCPLYPKSPVSTNLSTTATTQLLPFIQKDESALSCEQLLQLSSTAEPSLLKVADALKSSERQISSLTTIIAGYSCSPHGHEPNSYFSDTDEYLSSECGVSGGATCLLHPSSPEWDNRDLNPTPPSLPTFDVPFLSGGDKDDDEDSLADLEDCLIYYRTGDVLFGPPHVHNGVVTSSFTRNDWKGAYGYTGSSAITQAKLEECESLAGKVRLIKAQLSMIKEKRNQRFIRQNKIEKKDKIEVSNPHYGTKPVLFPVGVTANHDKPHIPKICSYGGQGLKRVPLHHPCTTTSAVILPTVTAPSNSLPSDNIKNDLLMPPRRCFEPDRRWIGAVPNKTTLDINLEAAVAPGFAGLRNCDGSKSSYFRSLRHGHSESVQPLDAARTSVSDQRTHLLDIDKKSEEEMARVDAKSITPLPRIFPPLVPHIKPKPADHDNLLRSAIVASLLCGHSPITMKTASYSNDASFTNVITHPCISNTLHENRIRSGGETADSGYATSTSSNTLKDTSEPSPTSSNLKSNRCALCNRKTGLADSYVCRCERTFCSRHRYAELHACSFDYKAEARRYIRETNPVVTAAKLSKI